MPETLYFNVQAITSDRIPKNHRNVTEERMLRHEAGLSGSFEGITDEADFRKECMGLYKVWNCTQRGMVVCECKSFWRLLQCPHVLVFSHVVLREQDLSTSLQKVCRVKRNTKIFCRTFKKYTAKNPSSASKSKAKVL
jgi:hypothetical protein